MSLRYLIDRLVRPFGLKVTARAPSGGGLDPRIAGLLRRHRVSLVLDVGANVGQYARALRAGGYDGRIVSFEPVAASHAALVRAAEGDPRWTVAERVALGSESGTGTIHVSNRSDMSSLLPIAEATLAALPKAYTVGEESVPLARLDDLFGRHAGEGDRAFLKIDTQGFEYPVLEGARESLRRLVGVQVELSLAPNYEGERSYLDVLGLLDRAGFEPHLVLPGYYSRARDRQLQIDAVLFRRDS